MNNILDQLQQLEPIFHAACPQATVEDFERLVAPNFWETGASGRIYDRAFALSALKNRPTIPDATMWQTSEYAVQVLKPEICLLTYRLQQPGRITRRMTVWQCIHGQWQAIYHQGTVVV